MMVWKLQQKKMDAQKVSASLDAKIRWLHFGCTEGHILLDLATMGVIYMGVSNPKIGVPFTPKMDGL